MKYPSIRLSFLLNFCCLVSSTNIRNFLESNFATIVEKDQTLVAYFQEYLAREELKLQIVKRVDKYFKNKGALQIDPYRYASDPFQNLKLMIRLAHEWRTLFGVLKAHVSADLLDHISILVDEVSFDSEEYADEASEKVLTFQTVLGISAKAMADGQLTNEKNISPLRGTECFLIGIYCSDQKMDYNRSLEWFLEADRRFNFPQAELKLKLNFYKYLAFAYYKLGDLKTAIRIIKKAWTYKLDGGLDMLNVYLYYKNIYDNLNLNLPIDHLENKNARSWADIPGDVNNFMKLCQKKTILPPSETATLKCRYTTNNSTMFILSPLLEEELWNKPKVRVYHRFLLDSEIDYMINNTAGHTKPSSIRLDVGQSGKSRLYRTGTTFFLTAKEHVKALASLHRRTDELAGLEGETAEHTQMGYYENGGYYNAHYDAYPDKFEIKDGNRYATVLFYLNDVEAGGETVFTALKISVTPERGAALYWENVQKNGDLEIFSSHGACPVLLKHKWIATRWYHHVGQVFKRPCSLNKDE